MSLRDSNIDKLDDGVFDVLIIGGGINGAVSAASLATRGVKVALIDRGDFAADVSSNSSNLAWGGIKYLESYELALVRKLCKCRNKLMREYPSTVQEIRFLTTIQKGFRFHPLMIFMGTILYWFIGLFGTRPPRYLSCAQINRREPAIDTSNAAGGFAGISLKGGGIVGARKKNQTYYGMSIQEILFSGKAPISENAAQLIKSIRFPSTKRPRFLKLQ